MDVDIISQTLQVCKTLDKVYAKSVILEAELSKAKTQADVSINFGKLQFAFNKF